MRMTKVMAPAIRRNVAPEVKAIALAGRSGRKTTRWRRNHSRSWTQNKVNVALAEEKGFTDGGPVRRLQLNQQIDAAVKQKSRPKKRKKKEGEEVCQYEHLLNDWTD